MSVQPQANPSMSAASGAAVRLKDRFDNSLRQAVARPAFPVGRRLRRRRRQNPRQPAFRDDLRSEDAAASGSDPQAAAVEKLWRADPRSRSAPSIGRPPIAACSRSCASSRWANGWPVRPTMRLRPGARRRSSPTSSRRSCRPLLDLDREMLPHRGIRPGNIFFRDANRRVAMLGDCMTSPPGLYQSVVYETIEGALAQSHTPAAPVRRRRISMRWVCSSCICCSASCPVPDRPKRRSSRTRSSAARSTRWSANSACRRA